MTWKFHRSRPGISPPHRDTNNHQKTIISQIVFDSDKVYHNDKVYHTITYSILTQDLLLT